MFKIVNSFFIFFYSGILDGFFLCKSSLNQRSVRSNHSISFESIYEEHGVSTNITKQEMKKMLILCTKKVHFPFNEEVYKQTDGVAMGSPLGPVLRDVVVELDNENNIVPVLRENLSFCKRYVDDTICFIKIRTIDYITRMLNNFVIYHF